MASGAGGAEQQHQQHQQFPHRHGAAEEGESGGAAEIGSEIPTDPGSAERNESSAGVSDTQVEQDAGRLATLLSITYQRVFLLILVSVFFCLLSPFSVTFPLSSCSETRCSQLKEELSNQRAEFTCQLQSLRAEMERSEEERSREKLGMIDLNIVSHMNQPEFSL